MAVSHALTRAALAFVSVLSASTVEAEPPRLVLLGAHNEALEPGRDALGISRHITHDRTLPRSDDVRAESEDPANFRLEIEAPAIAANVVYAHVETLGSDGTRHGLLRHVPLARIAGTPRFRSPFLRLVADATDRSAPGVGHQLLEARLFDRVRAVVPEAGDVSAELTVGRTDEFDADRTPLRGTLNLTVLRLREGGPPAIGDDVPEALALARRQVEIANEIWAQCFIDFGAPGDASVRVVNPPPTALLAVGDLDGLPTRGQATISFRANDRRIGPIVVQRGSTPERTAVAVARTLRQRGFLAQVTTNPRADLGADRSADVVVRDRRGALVTLKAEPGTPLSSDPQQSLTLGDVDLSDGIDEFDNTLAVTGTLEERTLIKLLSDDDPSTIDLFLVNRFVNRARQGEAFIEADGSSMANTLIFDRNAVRFERQAWVQAHELGHVLLDEAFHPDNIGPDRPWLLMDADARQGRATGPKRLSDAECARARRRSGPAAHPALLRVIDPTKPLAARK